MASHIVGYPRMGPKRELKFALESFWDGKSSAEELQKVSADLRSSIWKQMSEAGIKYIPSNTFSYYDQVLDTTAMLGAVPDRYNWNGGEIGFDTFFSMARGNATVPAMEMTKWFDTNYHYIVPELGPDVKFSYASHKAVNEYKEAKGNSRSDEKLLSVFREGVKYGAGIGPGVYDIHSPRIPSTEEIADRINKMLAVLETNILWVNPDCGLKTRKYTEVKPALQNMVAAAKLLRTQLASAK
ncbi:hypothetical protein Dsin_021560 [Dipteronia sinensis]|uniref:5-methyltetrahydropteroyltriglutamate--homocysteine S-methyltransferase n=1 Tax=Dipteronia sinensis TaxID=43782 RepID=A0AAE0DYX6_9ROSI|nr:hypothetical protein Dsin_021560 [Dipteronia sinensis]